MNLGGDGVGVGRMVKAGALEKGREESDGRRRGEGPEMTRRCAGGGLGGADYGRLVRFCGVLRNMSVITSTFLARLFARGEHILFPHFNDFNLKITGIISHNLIPLLCRLTLLENFRASFMIQRCAIWFQFVPYTNRP